MKKLFCMLVLLLALTCAFAACDSAPDNTPPDKDGISLEDFTNSDGVHIEVGTGTGHNIYFENGQLIINGEKVDYDFGFNGEDVITVEDGYLVVNGVKTEHQVKGEDVITVEDGHLVVNGNKTEHKVNTDPVISVEDGYVAVNGVKTEYKANKTDVITVEGGYLVVNGNMTEHKVKTPDTITVDSDGYLIVNGVKTDYSVKSTACNHIWKTVTTAPTCSKGGYDTMTCSLCDKSVKTNETSPIPHTYTTTYSVDDSYHWHQCTVCSAIYDKGLHEVGDEGICTVCQLPITNTSGVVYEISYDGTYAEVIGYDGTATQVKIASEYEGLPVKNIYDSAFANNYTITSVVIPDSVETIGDYAFKYCGSLSSVVIGDSVTSIGYSAFKYCDSLSSVVIGDSVTSIGDYAFQYCSSLSSVVIGNSVTSIGDEAFYSCSSLSSVVIGNSVTSIGFAAFDSCHNLSSLVIPDSVTSIDNYAFQNCGSLSSVVIGDSVTNIGYCAFYGCGSSLYTEYEFGKYLASGDDPYSVLIEVTNKNMSSYTIHEDTKIIAASVFSSCDRLTSITIPDSVTGISYSAFPDDLPQLEYAGTVAQAKEIFVPSAFWGQGSITINCSDGDYWLEWHHPV